MKNSFKWQLFLWPSDYNMVIKNILLMAQDFRTKNFLPMKDQVLFKVVSN